MTLNAVTSTMLAGRRHGFFTRHGGASSGVFEGLNCGAGSSDQSECVRINRRRVAQRLGLGDDALVTMHQVHSADVVTVLSPGQKAERADALVSNTPGVGLGVLTADCQPVLFADTKVGVIGAAHAGWRGALDGVLENTVEAMVALGASRADIHAVVGPSISQRAYEVGPEFLDTFMQHDPDSACFFANGAGDRYHFDLPSYGLFRLRASGIAGAEWTGHCTHSDPESFYSYRRSVQRGEADYGRLISVIRL